MAKKDKKEVVSLEEDWAKQVWKEAKEYGMVTLDRSKMYCSDEQFEQTVQLLSKKVCVKNNTEIIHHAGLVIVVRADYLKKRVSRPHYGRSKKK